GLNNLEAFTANAFFTAGMMLFEVPTGVVADLRGRRLSFLLGAATPPVRTPLYVLLWQLEAPFWAWALVSVLLGLGFTFFSGAMEAELLPAPCARGLRGEGGCDALHCSGGRGGVESLFGRAQAVQGFAMLTGSVLGGVIAQATNLG